MRHCKVTWDGAESWEAWYGSLLHPLNRSSNGPYFPDKHSLIHSIILRKVCFTVTPNILQLTLAPLLVERSFHANFLSYVSLLFYAFPAVFVLLFGFSPLFFLASQSV